MKYRVTILTQEHRTMDVEAPDAPEDSVDWWSLIAAQHPKWKGEEPDSAEDEILDTERASKDEDAG